MAFFALFDLFHLPRDRPTIVLAPRERECLVLAGQGKSACEIDVIVGLADETVTGYLKSARRKFGLRRAPSSSSRAWLWLGGLGRDRDLAVSVLKATTNARQPRSSAEGRGSAVLSPRRLRHRRVRAFHCPAARNLGSGRGTRRRLAH